MQKISWTEQNEQKNRRRRRLVLGSFGLLALALLFAYTFVWQRVYTLQLAEEHASRKLKVGTLKERIQSLQNEVEYLSSIENIEAIARQQLAMVPLREAQFAKATISPVAKLLPETPKPTSFAATETTSKISSAKSSAVTKKSLSKQSSHDKKNKPLAKKAATKSKGTGKAKA